MPKALVRVTRFWVPRGGAYPLSGWGTLQQQPLQREGNEHDSRHFSKDCRTRAHL